MKSATSGLAAALVCLAMLLAALPLAGSTALAAQADTLDAKAKGIIRERVQSGTNKGLMLGLVDAKGWRVFAAGTAWDDKRGAFSRDTIFELGRASRLFTALLLAQAAQKGLVKLSDPLVKYLPKGKYASPRLARITLMDLATHTAGLPDMPPGWRPANPLNPYARFDRAALLAWLAKDKTVGLRRGAFAYSSLGSGLLGLALSAATGKSFAELLKEEITGPLKMNSTGVAPDRRIAARMPHGHNAAGERMPRWDFQALAPAGGVYSTPRDLLTLLGGFLGLAGKPSLACRRMSTDPRAEGPDKVLKVGLGWTILKAFDKTILFEAGGSGGFRCFVGFCPQSKLGVVVLSNSAVEVSDIGLHLLAEQIPLRNTRKEISLPREALLPFAGRYRVAGSGPIEPGTIISIGLEEDGLTYQQGKQQPVPIKAQGKVQFFFPQVWDARVSFQKDAKGKVSGLELKAGAETVRATRLK